MLEIILEWGDLIVWSIVLLIILIISYYTLFVTRNRNLNVVAEGKINHFAILIPARNESKVIENILISIENQTFKQSMEDVYIIVEDINDPTVGIARRHGAQIFVRTQLENRHRKGYALDECIKNIIAEKKKYDGYFIFDADNTLDKDYLTQMNATFNKGYDLACGYRRPTNPNQNVISACSALIFTMINVFGNIEKAKKNYNVTITGTGFFIRGSVVECWNGYPFHSLTEDYELTMYATWKGLSSTYNENAIYMDEQPTTMKVSMKQRLRWVSGYFESRKIYAKKIKQADKENKQGWDKKIKSMGIAPFALMIIIIAVYLIFCLSLGIVAIFKGDTITVIDLFVRVGGVVLGIYIALMIFTGCMIYSEKNKTKYNLNTKLKALFFNPYFLATFLPLVFQVLFSKKEIGWDEIKHTGEKTK